VGSARAPLLLGVRRPARGGRAPVVVVNEAVRLAGAVQEHVRRVRQQLDGHLGLPPDAQVDAPEAACRAAQHALSRGGGPAVA